MTATTTQKKAPAKKAASKKATPARKPSQETLIELSSFENITADWSEAEFTGESGTVNAERVRALLDTAPRRVEDLLCEHPSPLLSAAQDGARPRVPVAGMPGVTVPVSMTVGVP